MSLSPIRRIYQITVGEESIVFYSRFLGEVGRDIAAVKYALGDVYQADLSNNSPQDTSVIGTQWFSCDGDGEPLTDVAMATFDKRLQKSLMSFQLKNQFLMMNYYWERNGLAAGVMEESNLPQALEQMIYRFDADFGTISEATIAVLHGWRPGSTPGNLSFTTEDEVVPEQIPKFMYDMYTDGTVKPLGGEIVHKIYDKEQSADDSSGNVESRFNAIAPEHRKWHRRIVESAIAAASSTPGETLRRVNASMDQDVAKLEDSERYIDYIASAITGTQTESVLYVATREALEILEEIASTDFSPEQREDLIASAVEPDHLSQVVPFPITNHKSGFFDRTEYSFQNLPPFDGISEDDKERLESAAEPKVLEFYRKELPEGSELKILKFVDLRAPSLRPGDVYRAFFHIDMTIVNSLDTATPPELVPETPEESTISRQQELDNLIEELESQYCIGGKTLDEESARIQYEKYRSFASKKKLEISREISQKLIKAKEPGANPRGVDLDLGIFGRSHLSQEEINSFIGEGALGITGLLTGVNPLTKLPFGDDGAASTTTPAGKNPISMPYGQLKDKTSKVADTFEELAPDIQKYNLAGPGTLPQMFNVNTEAARLRNFPQNIETALVEHNAGRQNRIELKDNTEIRIEFGDHNKGSTIKSVTVGEEPIGAIESSVVFERTAHYVRNIDELAGDGWWVLDAFQGGHCEDPPGPKEGVGVSYILRYTKNLTGTPKKEGTNFFHAWTEHMADNTLESLGMTAPERNAMVSDDYEFLVANDNPSLVSFHFGFEKSLPIIGEDCTEDDKVMTMIKSTLSLKRLLCEYVACLGLPGVQVQVPKIPKLKWPKMPSLIDNFWKDIAENAESLGKRLACMFLKGILDILNSPMCEERFAEGVFGAAASEAPEVKKAMAAGFLDTGVPSDKLPDAKSLIDALMSMLSASEICALLQGEPVNDEVYQIVRTVAESLGLGSYLSTREQISGFFIPIGLFMGPALCEQLSGLEDKRETCDETYSLASQIRTAAMKGEVVSPEQIQSAVDHAEEQLQKKADAMNFLMGNGSLQDLLPNFTSLENNPAFSKPNKTLQKGALIAAETALGMAEMTFVNSINNYMESYYTRHPQIARYGDDEYNPEANMKVQRAACNLKRFANENLDMSNFTSIETTNSLRKALFVLCDDYEKVSHPDFGERYTMNEQASRTSSMPDRFLANSLLDKYGIDLSLSNEDDARLYGQTLELQTVWELLFSIPAGDLEEKTRTITTLKDWIQPVFKGGPLTPGDIATLNSNYLNKINQIISVLQRDIETNTERAITTRNETKFLAGIKEFYNSQSALSQQDGSDDDLVSVKKDHMLTTTLRHPTEILRDSMQLDILESYGPGVDFDVAKTTYKIKDDFFLGTQPGDPYTVEYCEPVPDNLSGLEFDVLPRPNAYGKIITNIIRSNFTKYKTSNISLNQYFSDTNGRYTRDIAKQSFLDAYEGLYEQVAYGVKNSRIFTDDAYRERIDLKLRSKYYFDPQTGCYKNPNSNPKFGVINFQKLITDEFPEHYMREFADPSNSWLTEDYSTPGSFEKAMMNVSLLGFVRMCLIELLLKGAVTLSVWDIDFVKSNKIYRDYMVEFVRKQLEANVSLTQKRRFVDETIQRLSATNNIRAGLKKIVLKEADNVISSLSKDVFENSRDYNFSQWFLDSIPFVSVPNLRSEDSGLWTTNIDFDYANEIRYNNFMYLEDYVRVNGTIRDFRSSRAQIAAAQLEMLESRLPVIRAIDNANIIPGSLVQGEDISRYDIGNPDSVSIEGAFNDDDDYANTELMSLAEFSNLMQAMMDNNSELSRYFHDLSGKTYNPSSKTHGLPKVLETQSATPSRVIKRTRQHIKFDKINIFSLLLKSHEDQNTGGGERTLDKFIDHHHGFGKQVKHAYLFNVLTTGEYGKERHQSYSENAVSSLVRRAFSGSFQEEDRYYMLTDKLSTALEASEQYSALNEDGLNQARIYDKYNLVSKSHRAAANEEEKALLTRSVINASPSKTNSKISNFKSSDLDPIYIERENPSRITRNIGQREVLFSTPKNKTTKEEYDLFVQENPNFETEIWEETVIDLVGDAAPIFQFPGDSGWVPKDHMSEEHKTRVGSALRKSHWWFNNPDGTWANGHDYIDGIRDRLFMCHEETPEVIDDKKTHFVNVFGWTGTGGVDASEKAYPIKSFGSAYGNKWRAYDAYKLVFGENTRTYYKNDLVFEKSSRHNDYRIDYDTEQLTPNEYKIPLRILITQVKNNSGDILKVFVRYVLPQFLDFERQDLNNYRAEKITEACEETLGGWNNFIVKSFKKIMFGWYSNNDGRYEQYKSLYADENPDPLTSSVYYHPNVITVLRQGRGDTAHPMIPFVKGTEIGPEGNGWWDAREPSWVSSSKLYSHACRIEADNKQGNFADDRAFLDDLFQNPGNLLRKPGNSRIKTNPAEEYSRFKNDLINKVAGSGSDHELHANPSVLNSGHASNFDDHVRELFIHYNLSKHILYDSSMHDALQLYTGYMKEDSKRVANSGTAVLQTVGNLVSWFSQKRTDAFWGKTTTAKNRWKLLGFGRDETKDEWLEDYRETKSELLWEKVEAENTRCGPSLFYNDMRCPLPAMFYNCMRKQSLPERMDFIDNIEKETINRQKMPHNHKDTWNWMLKNVTQINAYTHFKKPRRHFHLDQNLATLIGRLHSDTDSGFLRDPHDGANFFIQTDNRGEDPSSTEKYFYWKLSEQEAKDMNIHMHSSEVPSTIHGKINPDESVETINAALNDDLLPYKRHIINNIMQTPRVASNILSRFDAALAEIGLTNIIREVTTGYTSLLEGDETIISDIINDSQISYGIRVNMHNTMTPGSRNSDGTEFEQSTVNSALEDLWTRNSNAGEEERCGKLKIATPSGEEKNFYSIPIVSNERTISDINCFQATNLVSLEQKIEELKPEMKRELTNSQEFKDFFEFTLPYKNIATSLTIHGTTMLAGYGEMPLFLTSTKSALAAAFSASTIVDPFGNDPGKYLSAADSAIVYGPTGPAGGDDPECLDVPDMEEWIKMLAEQIAQFIKYFPSVVLRGIADQIDPMYKEMKRHYLACEIPNLRNGSWTTSSGGGRTPLGLRGSKQGEKKYAPIMPAFPYDAGKGLSRIIWGGSPDYFLRSIDKLVGYIVGGPLPLIDGMAAFKIPCAKIDAEAMKSWQDYTIGNSGRFGHPINPLNLLALMTLELPRDRDLRRSICQNRDNAPVICEEE